MDYGGMGGGGIGSITTGLGGGTAIALLPNTGGSLKVAAIVALISVIVGAVILISALARLLAIRKLSC